ncbi:MAG: DUF4861 domain-containing protein [Muribaculaceae bacterium]|nr:DUF4861 domain-containing protein [Muribaculaceae bacterium]
MTKHILALLLPLAGIAASAQTDAYIKLRDSKNKHPRILSVTFPGNADNLEMYNSIYGHGAVIENPWVAYRVYMDNRQSLDLYAKQRPQLELDVTGFYTTRDQLAQGYGCDILWAGKSVAAGSFRGWDGKSPLTIDKVEARTQSVLNDSTVTVHDKAWQYNGHAVDMLQTYSVSGADRDLDVVVKLDGYKPDDIFCTGIQKLESNNQGMVSPEGWAVSWGENVPDKGGAPDLVEGVGLAIVVDPANVVSTLEDDLNYLVLVRPDEQGTIRYRVIACGTREADGFRSFDQWKKYVTSSKLK